MNGMHGTRDILAERPQKLSQLYGFFGGSVRWDRTEWGHWADTSRPRCPSFFVWLGWDTNIKSLCPTVPETGCDAIRQERMERAGHGTRPRPVPNLVSTT